MISLGEFSLFFADTIKMCPLIEMLMSFISVGGVGRMLKTRMFKSFVNLVSLKFVSQSVGVVSKRGKPGKFYLYYLTY